MLINLSRTYLTIFSDSAIQFIAFCIPTKYHISMVIRESFPCKNIPEILDPSCKTGLDIWARFKGEKLSNSRVTHDWFSYFGYFECTEVHSASIY